MESKTYEQLAKEFIDKHEKPTVKDVYDFLEQNSYRIGMEYEKECHRQDILDVLDEKNLKAKTHVIDLMLDDYEDHLGDSDEWRIVLDNTLDRFFDDIETGILDDEE